MQKIDWWPTKGSTIRAEAPPDALARDMPAITRMNEGDLKNCFEELRRLVLEESQRTRSHIDAVTAQLAQRVESGQHGQKVMSAEVRGLVARLDRLPPVRR